MLNVDPRDPCTIVELAEALRERYSISGRTRLVALLRAGIRADERQNRIEMKAAERVRRREYERVRTAE